MIDSAELQRQYFERGKQVLGKTAGGLLAWLLKAKGGDLALARAAVEIAATKQDPKEYIAKFARPVATGVVGNGAGERLSQQAEKQLNARATMRPHTEAEKAAVAASLAAFRGSGSPPEPVAVQQRNEGHASRVIQELEERRLKRLGAVADKIGSTLEEQVDDWDVWP